ncbi:MAG: MFS transporter, partial [Bryobacteraceae bacterium]
MASGKYRDLLQSGGFESYLWTQFLGAFNDNTFKIVVSLVAVDMATEGSGYLSLVGVIFMVPFFLFSGYAGQLADIHSKRTVLVLTKGFEVAAMGLGLLAFLSGRVEAMLGVLFLMALHSTFFSPAKYGILPEILGDKDLTRANALLEMTTFMAIVLGTSGGSFLFAAWKANPERIGMILIVIAVIGFATSFGIPKVRPAVPNQTLSLNPWGEIALGMKRLYNDKPLWLTVIAISYFWFLGALLQMDIIVFGKEVVKADDLGVGILVTFLAVGIGLGSLAAGRLSGDKVELGLVPIGSIGMGVFCILLAFSGHSYTQASIMMMLMGFFSGFFIVPLNALLQQKSGPEETGRLIATNNFLNTAGVLLASGGFWLCHDYLHISPDRILVIFGVVSFAATAYILTVLPDFLIRFSLWLATHTIYRIRIVGQENVPFRGGALLVCNHISFMDGLLVAACIQRFVRFMMYKPYYDMKSVNWLFRSMKAIPVSASNRREMMASLERAREELKAGHVVCIFAEGAISRTGNLLPFKRGFERIVDGVDVPVIPVHLDRLWGSVFSFERGKFLWKWPRKIPYPVTVSFGEAMPSSASAQQVRQATIELSADALEYRREPDDVLPRRFISTARGNWRSFCMTDSSGKELTYGEALTGAIVMGDAIRAKCAEERMLGLLLPSSVGGALANIGVMLAGKTPVNLNFTTGR